MFMILMFSAEWTPVYYVYIIYIIYVIFFVSNVFIDLRQSVFDVNDDAFERYNFFKSRWPDSFNSRTT